MSDLIARLEKATGPDRELDQAIAAEIGLSFPKWPPFYTESIDSAVTLVPEGMEWSVGRNSDGSFGAAVGNTVDLGDIEVAQQIKGGPALALCIAAMKARAGKE